MTDRGCSGECEQGRNPCPTPQACQVSEELPTIQELLLATWFKYFALAVIAISLGLLISNI
jgi:hypothetical protein